MNFPPGAPRAGRGRKGESGAEKDVAHGRIGQPDEIVGAALTCFRSIQLYPRELKRYDLRYYYRWG